jgi:hypothetical protein
MILSENDMRKAMNTSQFSFSLSLLSALNLSLPLLLHVVEGGGGEEGGEVRDLAMIG